MLVLTNEAKDFLDKNNIPYAQYDTTAEIYMNYVLNASMETAMRYNDADVNDPDVVDKYVQYVKEHADLSKIYTRLEKFEYDALRVMNDTLEDKHDEIIKTEPKNDK